MRKLPLLVLALFLAVATPGFAKVDDDHENGKRHINATELSALGFAGALLVGGIGYLLLRRRKSTA